jgi:hypothetical protein
MLFLHLHSKHFASANVIGENPIDIKSVAPKIRGNQLDISPLKAACQFGST